MFFNKPKTKYNLLNDLDSNVFNLFDIVSNRKDELEQQFKIMPIHSDLIKYWNKNEEIEPIRKALRFLLLSNFVMNGRGTSVRLCSENGSSLILESLPKIHEMLFGCHFANMDFRKFIKSIADRSGSDSENIFIYCDPPYLGTADNYENGFKEQDSLDLFDVLIEKGYKFAMSEFNNPFILEQAKQRNLNVIIIGERQNLKNRRTEILVTNYKNNPTLFD